MMTPAKRTPPNAGKGRVKGVPNKVTSDLKAMIEGALSDAGGRDYLRARAIDTPGPFLALVGKLLPKDIKVEGEIGVTLRDWLKDAK